MSIEPPPVDQELVVSCGGELYSTGNPNKKGTWRFQYSADEAQILKISVSLAGESNVAETMSGIVSACGQLNVKSVTELKNWLQSIEEKLNAAEDKLQTAKT